MSNPHKYLFWALLLPSFFTNVQGMDLEKKFVPPPLKAKEKGTGDFDEWDGTRIAPQPTFQFNPELLKKVGPGLKRLKFERINFSSPAMGQLVNAVIGTYRAGNETDQPLTYLNFKECSTKVTSLEEIIFEKCTVLDPLTFFHIKDTLGSYIQGFAAVPSIRFIVGAHALPFSPVTPDAWKKGGWELAELFKFLIESSPHPRKGEVKISEEEKS